MATQIKVGVVGCGYWGPNLIRNFRALPDCNLTVMCDSDEKRLRHLKTLYPEVRGESDFHRMLSGAGLDAVVIATSVRTHYPLAKASLLAGKHTFIEKPMAASSAECEELIAIAETKHLTLMVGHTFLYSAPVRRIKEIVEWGDIGDVRYISTRRLNLGLFQKDINVAWDLAPHDISIVLYILGGSPLSVNCWGNAHITPNVEDVTCMCLNFRDDRFAMIQSSWLDPKKVRDMTIVGTKRMIVYDDVEPLEKLRIYDACVEVPPHYDSFAEFQYSYHYGDSYIPFVKQEEPLKTECQHFLDCIREGRQPISGGKQGLELVKILEASTLSLKQNGAPVLLSHSQPQDFVRLAAAEQPVEVGGNGHSPNGNGHSPNGNGHSPNGNGHSPNGNGHSPNGNGNGSSGINGTNGGNGNVAAVPRQNGDRRPARRGKCISARSNGNGNGNGTRLPAKAPPEDDKGGSLRA